MMSHQQQQQHQIPIQTTSDHESSVPTACNSSVSVSSISNLLFSEKISPVHNLSCFQYNTYNYRGRRGKSFSYDSCVSSATPRPWNKLKYWFGSFSLMATQDELMVHDPVQSKKKMATAQQKEELEREVSVLQKMLEHEQNMHEYLARLQNQKDGSVLSIPTFLPPQVKEFLAELAMVENEIMRLESQISQLQSEVKRERDIKMESKSMGWERGTAESKSTAWERGPPKNYHELPPIPNGKKFTDKVAFETKALHFISKAIKGDYNLSDFSKNEKNLKLFSPQKENAIHAEEGSFREKVSKRSGLLKSPSPMRELRNPTPRRDRYLDTPTDSMPRVLSTPLHSEEENIQKWTPNKLSENIMKCLVFIYVRLLRTSRTMELERSGPIARSSNFSLSFRQESSSSLKTNLMFQKDSRQQDPYGIFDSEESIPRDIGPYKNLVRFTSSSMDLKCIQNSSSVPLFQKLKNLMNGLQKVDLRFLSHQQKLAFWINMYNACVMHGFLQYGVPSVSSSENLLTLINKATLNIGGNSINAQAIEHFILRKPADALIKEILAKGDKDKKEMIARELYGIQTPDPNITFALCCGTRSSPAVKIYTADGVQAELEKAKLEYLQAAIVVKSTRKIALPELLLRSMHDFAEDKDSLMEWVCHQLPTSGTLRKSIVECYRGLHTSKSSSSSSASVEKIPHDFEFQYLLAI